MKTPQIPEGALQALEQLKFILIHKTGGLRTRIVGGVLLLAVCSLVSTTCNPVVRSADVPGLVLEIEERGLVPEGELVPHSRILIHQPMGGFQGQATDIDIHAREILRMREELNEILANHTGQPMDRLQVDTERDFFMTGEQAKEYGIIDEVVTQKN